MRDEMFSRSEALLGEEALKRLSAAKVLIVGIGGVGSWCAEALVRTGVGKITLVDDDLVATSNINRQCPATVATIGRAKVEVMAERLREINPDCEVTAVKERYERPVKGGAPFNLDKFDIIVDAIDSAQCKAELILEATQLGVPIISSLGAALRMDPTKVSVTRFEKVTGDGLAKALRQRFKKWERFPAAKFMCVHSTECPQSAADNKSRGSLMPVTATFGMCLASEAIKIIMKGKD